MTREEAIQILADLTDSPFLHTWEEQYKALHMAIESLQADAVPFDVQLQSTREVIDRFAEDRVKVVRCKDCRYAGECHKSVQYTRNEPRTVTMGYAPIDFCSHGERREE